MYDVVIVGAGIIGSFTASRLARLGYHVCLLERDIAGHKSSCTGIVSSECFKLLEPDPKVVQQEACSARIFAPSGSFIRVDRQSTQAHVLNRPALDSDMAARAQACGAEYRPHTLVKSISQHDHCIVASCLHHRDSYELKAKAMVIATGFGGNLPEQLGLGRISNYAHGAQAEVICQHIEETEVYCGSAIAPGFFAWLVPAGKSLAKVGLLCRNNPREYMHALLNRLAAEGKIVRDDYPVSYGNIPLKTLGKTYGKRFVVIGDAAGQAKPTTGGGIYFGLLAAREAIDVLDKALKTDDLSARCLSRYQQRWHKILREELTIDYWAHRFYQKLNDRQICHIFDVIERHGIHESFLTSPDISFDWHGKIIIEAIKHRSLQRSLKEFNQRMPGHIRQQL